MSIIQEANMRHFLTLPLLAVSLSLSVPASAKDRAPETEMIEKLNDPAFQDGMASMMSGLMTAMMELPIGKFVNAVEKAVPEARGQSSIDPDATIGDLARRDDPDFDRNIERKMRKGTAMMGIMASEFGAMLPQLREMADKMKRRMEDIE